MQGKESTLTASIATDALQRGTSARIPMFGCQVDNLSLDEAINRIQAMIDQGGTHRYFALNVHKVVVFRKFPELLRIANSSDLVTADGQPIVWASRRLGKPLRTRVAGVDLMSRLIELACERQYRIFLLGARADVLAETIEHYQKRYPRLQIAASRHGYWAEHEEGDVVRQVREARPHILFLGMSSPKKEFFTDRHLEELQVPFVIGVGGAFDLAAGVTRRAPRWMQRCGLEWFWRVLQEPRRLWKRYLQDGVQFAWIVMRELLRREKQ